MSNELSNLPAGLSGETEAGKSAPGDQSPNGAPVSAACQTAPGCPEKKQASARGSCQEVVDNIPSGFVKIRMNPDGSAQPVLINQAFCDMTGMTAEETMALYRKDSFAGVHPDDLERMREIAGSFRPGGTSSCTVRLKKGASDWVWMRITTSVREENGATVLYNSYLDISAEQENRFMIARLLNELPGGVAIFKIADKLECQYFNDGFAALSGRSRQEQENMFRTAGFFERSVYPTDILGVLEDIKRHTVSGEPINTTFRYLTKCGKPKWLHATASKLREEDGCPVYYCVFTEPTRQNLLYQSIADESNVGILVSDERTHEIYYANRAFRELMHISDSSFNGKKCYEYVMGTDHICDECAARDLPVGAIKENIKYLPALGIYVRIRFALVSWLGRNALVKYVSDITANYQKQLQQQQLLNNVPSGFGVFELGRDVRRLVHMNDYFYRMVGAPRGLREDMLNDGGFMSLVHPDDRAAVDAMIAGLLSGDDLGRVDHRILCGSGEYRWLRLTASVVNREDEKLTVYCSYTDLDETISAQKELERANRIIQEQLEAEQEKRRLIEKDSVAAYRINLTRDRLLEYYAASSDLMQFAPGNTSGKIVEELRKHIPVKREHDQIEDFFGIANNIKLFQGGVTERVIEYRIRLTDGRLRWRRAVARFSREVFSGDIVSYTYIRDIDYEKKKGLAAESLVEEETDYVILLSASADVCRLLRVKSSFSADSWQLGKEADFSTLGMPDRLSPVVAEDRGSVRRFFDRIALIEGLKKQSVITLTFRQITEDSQIRRKKIRAFYLDDTREDIIIAMRDITDLYEEEQEQKHALQNAFDEAMAASRAKGTFLSNMSHEIRTPINAIIGMTELAQDDAKDPAIRESLASIRNSGIYLLNIINDILDMSRIESGKFTLDCQWISPTELLNPCIDMIRPAAEAKHITLLTPSLDKSIPFEYYVDVIKTQRMLMNILNNACKFTGEGGRISLSFKNVSHDGDSAVDLVTVEDTGCGMSKEFLTRIFEPFAQEHNIYSSTAAGTGLGLSLARQTALAMGGDIVAESTPGVGSKFTITFPYKYRFREIGSRRPEPEQKPDFDRLRNARILLCEDNSINAVIARRLLEKEGCIVDCAENGLLGVERFAGSAPGGYQAVLMDIRMPKMDGLEATRAIRALDRGDAQTVPIVAMSANAFDEDVSASLAAGMNAHLAKPVEPRRMYEVLAGLIRQTSIVKEE